MPFKKGAEWSGNRGSRKVPGLSRPVRASQGLETWARLLRMRDELVVERQQIGVDDKGKPIVRDVVLDAAMYFKVLEKSSPTVGASHCRKSTLTAKPARYLALP